uniref:USP domain-containing protein n=1 Tax=Solanum lycopersicum TaxID=4081 RepID=K4CJK3_SOLLC
MLGFFFSIKKVNANNVQTSPDHEAPKIKEIEKYNVDFSSVKIEVDEKTKEKDSVLDERSLVQGSGMCNLGNTCLVNAVVQSFMHTIVLLQLLGSIDHISPCDSKFSPDFSWYQQEDAHEFLQFFLNKLELLQFRATSLWRRHLLRCCNYCHLSITQEPLIDISLEIQDVDSVPAAPESFTKIEKIEYSCERCKTHGPFEKELLVDRAPFVAALHFKIFKNNGVVVHKVDKHVSFPLELDKLLYTSKINNVVFVEEDFVLAKEVYILFYANRGTPWFLDYIKIHRPFIKLVVPTSPCIPNNYAFVVGESNNGDEETSMKHEHNKTEGIVIPVDVKIKLSCSRDEEFMEAHM